VARAAVVWRDALERAAEAPDAEDATVALCAAEQALADAVDALSETGGSDG
jgi:hypothetical protein